MLQIGDKLPDFVLLGTDGQMHNNYEWADKYALLIVFTCNSCTYSQAYGKRLIRLLNQYNEDNLGIVAINSNDQNQSPGDSFAEMQKIAEKLGLAEINFHYLYDEKQEVAKTFGARFTPEAFLFNSKRELVYKGAIDDAPENMHMVTMAYLEDAIEYCLDGIDVDYPETEVSGCPIVWKK